MNKMKIRNFKIQFHERFKSSIIGKEEYLAEKEHQLQRELGDSGRIDHC